MSRARVSAVLLLIVRLIRVRNRLWRRDTLGVHNLLDGGDGARMGTEVTGAMALRDPNLWNGQRASNLA